MKIYITAVLLIFVSTVIFSCAHLGFHGPSIRTYPHVHSNVTEDRECIKCHHGDDPEGPLTPHPNFSGCLKCHNDEIHS